MMCGGHSEHKTPNAEDLEFFAQCRQSVEAKAGQQFAMWEVSHFTTQVVAGTIFWVSVKVDNDVYIHAKIVRPLPHTGKGPECLLVCLGKKQEDAFDVTA